MDKTNEEGNKQEIKSDSASPEKSTSEVSNDKKLNDYISLIEKAKEPFKKEIFKIPTKEEKLIYVRQQIQKYSIMKESSRLSSFMTIFVTFIIVISFIIFFARTSNTIFFKSLMFAILVVAGVLWLILFLNMKRDDKKYSIIIFALEELNIKVSGSIEGGSSEIDNLNKDLKNIADAIDETRRQVKEGYAIIEQRIRDNFRGYN